jgi:lipopolysaccharide transport system ATP-binding protein
MAPAIRIENIGKSYRIAGDGQRADYRTLRESLMGASAALLRRIRHRLEGGVSEEFWALKDINLEVQRGEIVGFIGRNGAGKSTLLKILSRITRPTTGRIELRGRVGSLLEVGTGFHPELTGRENIFLNGGILGMSRREIGGHFDEIVEFSGIARFLDTPVKRYSSGMYVRLAFAVAAHLDPEILIIDEVLAVGDYEFQRKCLGKMEEVARGGAGRTILFVSHNIGMIRSLCSRCVYLDAGRLVAVGPTEAIIDAYEHSQVSEDSKGIFRQSPDERFALQVLEAELRDRHGRRQTSAIDQFSPLYLAIRYIVREPLVGCNISVKLVYQGMNLFLSFDTDEDLSLLERRDPGHYQATIPLPAELLKPGRYTIGLNSGIINLARRPEHQLFENLLAFEVREAFATSLKGYAPHRSGAIALRLDWNTRRVGIAMNDPVEDPMPSGDTARPVGPSSPSELDPVDPAKTMHRCASTGLR